MNFKNSFITNVLPKNYLYDHNNKIWHKEEAKLFMYSDGDQVENDIATQLAQVQDRSVLSEELAKMQDTWPTMYHYSAKRANLLRPLEKNLLTGARILELGCGMGAVTRYLGETAKEVVGVEGSLRRGIIASLRCEDLDNVQIIVDQIQDLPADLGKFDIVTLIGVLEYARVYNGPSGEKKLLELARRFLKPGGALILAIENKLGLKYLAGVPEDHLQRRWQGVVNGYRDNGVQTWSRKELVKLLREAGFNKISQFLPIPDYKLPVSVITPAGLKEENLNLGAILWDTGRMFETRPVFNLGEAWESIIDAGLLQDMANSLCFVAQESETAQASFEEDALVYHYGNTGNYSMCYAKEVKIVKDGEKINVKRRRLKNDLEPIKGIYKQVLEDEHYYPGPLLIEEIRRVVMKPDWTLENLFESFKPWLDILQKLKDENQQIDGSYLDISPFNLVKNNGEYKIFDQEWIADKKLSYFYILMRGFQHTIHRIMPLRRSTRHNIQTFKELFIEFIKYLNQPGLTADHYDYAWWLEKQFMQQLFQMKYKTNNNYALKYINE